jgi:hypothetical protein
MSAMTIAVAVIHDTLPADILPAVAAAKAESVMSDLFFATSPTLQGMVKIQQVFCFSRAALYEQCQISQPVTPQCGTRMIT